MPATTAGSSMPWSARKTIVPDALPELGEVLLEYVEAVSAFGVGDVGDAP